MSVGRGFCLLMAGWYAGGVESGGDVVEIVVAISRNWYDKQPGEVRYRIDVACNWMELTAEAFGRYLPAAGAPRPRIVDKDFF